MPLSRQTRTSVAAAAVLVVVLVGAGPVHAYVRRTNNMGVPLWWRTRAMSIAGYEQGFGVDLTADQIAGAMSEAALQWTRSDPDLATCTDLQLPVAFHDISQVPPDLARDGVNTIAARTAWPYDHVALAQTSLFYVKSSGEILEADLEVNAEDFTWADVTVDTGRGLQDLQNALTHELGHFIGLDHPCYLSDVVTDETDNLGQPVPNCNAVPFNSPIREATMFPSADPGDVSKRTLSGDDDLAVCDIYPAGLPTAGANATGTDKASGCTCALSAGAAPSGLGDRERAPWFAFGLGGVLMHRRRRRRRPDCRSEKSCRFEGSLPRGGPEA